MKKWKVVRLDKLPEKGYPMGCFGAFETEEEAVRNVENYNWAFRNVKEGSKIGYIIVDRPDYKRRFIVYTYLLEGDFTVDVDPMEELDPPTL